MIIAELILRTRYASALRLMLGALHLVVFTQHSWSNLPRLAYKQACRLALRRLSGAGNNPQVLMTVAITVAIEEASK